MKPTYFLLAATLLMTTFPSSALSPVATAPDAAKKPHEVKAPFGATRNDEYYWLRDDKRKNRRCSPISMPRTPMPTRVLAPPKPLQEKLYDEIVGRIKQDDTSVPVPRARLLVLHALRDRQGLSDPGPPQGQHGRA